MRPKPERILDYREFPVLVVDDEPENLRLFQRSLEGQFEVLTATSGDEAQRLVAARPVAVVLSDHRMRGMTGVELLARMKEIDPRTIRILVTAYGDAATLGDAINDGSVYRYIPKPCSPPELQLAVKRAVEVYALDREREELVRELSTLSWVSKIITQELELDSLLDLLLEMLTGELGFDAGTLLLFDEARDALVCARTHPGEGPEAAEISAVQIPVSSTPPLVARLREGEGQLLRAEGTAEPDPFALELLHATGAEQALVVPLLAKGRLLGALEVDNRTNARPFSVSDRTLLEGIAGQAAIALANARLVEDLRRSRQRVVRAERLGILGTLAAGLAHEINNPLVSIHTFLSLATAKRHLDDAEFWGDYHQLTCREVARIRGLVASMARLGRGGTEPVVQAPCHVGQLAEEVTTLLAREAQRAAVVLRAEPDPATPKVVGQRDPLQQLLLNLVLNAIQATPVGGTVWIRTGPDGRQGACIEVTDTGTGIPPDDLERIFDPFYTTKDPDEGTGLGLMICHGIVQDHGGTIEVESREGVGTTVRVRLPQTPPQPDRTRDRGRGSPPKPWGNLDPGEGDW